MDEKPVVYLLHGDDPFAIERALSGMLARMGDPAMAELNLNRLDGREANEEAIFSAANAMPFLTDRRMVVLTNPLARLNSEAARSRFRAFLDQVPESTAMVLVLCPSLMLYEVNCVRRRYQSLHPLAVFLRRPTMSFWSVP